MGSYAREYWIQTAIAGQLPAQPTHVMHSTKKPASKPTAPTQQCCSGADRACVQSGNHTLAVPQVYV